MLPRIPLDLALYLTGRLSLIILVTLLLRGLLPVGLAYDVISRLYPNDSA